MGRGVCPCADPAGHLHRGIYEQPWGKGSVRERLPDGLP